METGLMTSGRELLLSGPVDRMKSAKSLVLSFSILASRGTGWSPRLTTGLDWMAKLLSGAAGSLGSCWLGIVLCADVGRVRLEAAVRSGLCSLSPRAAFAIELGVLVGCAGLNCWDFRS